MYRRTKLKTFADLTHAHEPKTIAAKNSTQESRIFHQKEKRVEAHIFVSFLAYCLHVTLGQRLRALAPGLAPKDAIVGLRMIVRLTSIFFRDDCESKETKGLQMRHAEFETQ